MVERLLFLLSTVEGLTVRPTIVLMNMIDTIHAKCKVYLTVRIDAFHCADDLLVLVASLALDLDDVVLVLELHAGLGAAVEVNVVKSTSKVQCRNILFTRKNLSKLFSKPLIKITYHFHFCSELSDSGSLLLVNRPT